MSSLSLVIPAYNEARRLPSTLQGVVKIITDRSFSDLEVIVVDDGSTDGTAACAEAAAESISSAGATLRVLRNPRNRGKGHSVRRGMLASQCDWVLVSDADQSTPLGEIDKLLQAAREGNLEIVIGSRALDRSLIEIRQPILREVAGRVFNAYMRALTRLEVADSQCGFKLFSRRAVKRIAARQRVERFGFDVEQLYLAQKMGLTFAEVPVRWSDSAGTSVGTVDGLNAFIDVWRVVWNDLLGRYA